MAIGESSVLDLLHEHDDIARLEDTSALAASSSPCCSSQGTIVERALASIAEAIREDPQPDVDV